MPHVPEKIQAHALRRSLAAHRPGARSSLPQLQHRLRKFLYPAFLRRAADYGEFFAAHIEELLRGDPAARQELARLQEAMLRTDMTRLLPPHSGKRGKSGARAKAPPEETADRTVKSSAKSKRPKPR